MTRDFDLVRKLLIFFDEKQGPEHVEVPNVGEEYTESQVMYHCTLLYQAGLLNCGTGEVFDQRQRDQGHTVRSDVGRS